MSLINVKVLDKEKALVGACSVIVKSREPSFEALASDLCTMQCFLPLTRLILSSKVALPICCLNLGPGQLQTFAAELNHRTFQDNVVALNISSKQQPVKM